MTTELPDDRRYTAEHEWVLVDGEVVRIGITDYAQEQLGDVVFVDLPEPGSQVQQGQSFGEVESTKSVSDLYAPISGVVVERNDHLDDQPELVNSDPYGQGWLITIRAEDVAQVEGLLDATAYRGLVE
ncbi:MAG: glycine cleavage system protein GcvH [Nitriliruptoraceae bacterium]